MPFVLLLRLLGIGLVILALTGCASLERFWSPATSGTEWVRRTDVCESWKKWLVSHKDVLTTDTATQVRGNNASHEVFCPTPQ